jgi:ABC-2 type transport system permease protein
MSAPTVTASSRRTDVAVPSVASRAVLRLAARRIGRGAFLVLTVAAGMSALVAATYRTVMADSDAAGSLGALAANPAIRTLFGKPFALDDPGGFTVWRTGTVVTVLLGAWSVLATTRITRGEEDAGRWDLLTAGRIPLPSVVARHLLVTGSAVVLVGAAVWAALVAAGTSVTGAAVHATGVAVLGLFFVGVAGLAAQILPARSRATGAAIAVLGLTLVARMIGDGVVVLAWLRWASPFGLLELSRPYAGNRWPPLILLAGAAAVAIAAAITAARRRDVRDGLVAPAAGRAPRMRLLGSVEAFAVRRMLRPLAGWSVGVGAYFLLIGLIAVTMTDFLTDNPVFADAAAQAGFAGLASVEGYAATLFAVLAVPVGGFAADRIGAFARAEADGRLTLLAARPVRRVRLLGAETAAAAAGVVVLVTVAGVATWLGVALTGGGLTLATAWAGTANTVPIVLLSLGAAVLAVGWMPRATAAVGALPAVGGFLLQATAASAGAPPWVIDISPFAHLAPVPLAAPNWTALGVMTVVAVVLAGVGAAGFHRRDLRA